MTLHHFRKEFRYLRLRWFAFLLLLGFDLAVNLEWVMPMRAGVETAGWLSYLPVVILLTGLSLLLSCPEDRPGSERSFVSTRPLPWAAYWWARVLVWLALIVLPVVVQNGLYLLLCGRPWGDVLRGMGERACFAVGFSAWLLPALALWRRDEVWKAVVITAVALGVVSKLLDVAGTKWWNFYSSAYQTWAGVAVGWMVFGLLSGWVAWRHLKEAYSFRRRLWLTCGLAVTGLLAARFWPVMTDAAPVAQNQALVETLAPGLKVETDLETARFEGFENAYPNGSVFAQPETETGKQGVHVALQMRGSVAKQKERTYAGKGDASFMRRSRYNFDSPQSEVHRGDANLRDFFPAGTLLYSGENFPTWSREGRITPLAAFEKPYPEAGEPLELDTQYEVEWYQRDLALEVPLVAGSRGECEEARWEVLEVKAAGGPQPGALTVMLRVETRAHWNEENGSAMLLHSPQRRMAWLEPAQQRALGRRATHTGWNREQRELTWNGIFNYADGEPAGVEAAKLRLILLRSRFLGTSLYTWKSPEMKLADFPSQRGNSYHWHSSRDVLYAGRQVKAFQERLATMKPLTAESSEKEARRYLYDLFSTLEVTRAAYVPAGYSAITEAFDPLGRYALPLLLDLPSGLWPGWSNRPPISLLDRYLTEDQREVVIDRVIQKPLLIDVLMRKGWVEASKRLRPEVLKRAPLPPNCEELLFAWGDDESHAKLMQAAKHQHGSGWVLEKLAKLPELRAEAERLAMEEYARAVPLISSDSYVNPERCVTAANFGSVEAFDLCLRWIAMGGDLPRYGASYPHPRLLTAEGDKFWVKEEKKPDHERWPFFRRLKVSDFDYVPEQRAWKFRQP